MLSSNTCKTGWISNVEGNAIHIKERCNFCTRTFQYYWRRFNLLFGGRFEKFHQLLFQFFKFTQYSSYCFLCIFECTTDVIIIFFLQQMGAFLLCVCLTQDAFLYVLFALEVLHFVTENAHSILGCPFLRIHLVCNSEILPNIILVHYFVAARNLRFQSCGNHA